MPTKKGMESASADVGLMLVAYNLRRILNIVGLERLLAYARACAAYLSLPEQLESLLEAL